MVYWVRFSYLYSVFVFRANLIHRRIITYVLLCGYSPFRSEDVKVLIKETTEAKIEFHERYWKNVSLQGGYWF
jgi:hypothetical protein